MDKLLLKFIKFGAVGFSGVFVDFGITWLLKEKMGQNRYFANTVGFLCAVVSNYFLNRIWTFEDHNTGIILQFSKFFAASLIGLAMNNAVIYFLNEKRNVNFYVAKIMATGLVTVWNFWANYTFTFKT